MINYSRSKILLYHDKQPCSALLFQDMNSCQKRSERQIQILSRPLSFRKLNRNIISQHFTAFAFIKEGLDYSIRCLSVMDSGDTIPCGISSYITFPMTRWWEIVFQGRNYLIIVRSLSSLNFGINNLYL